MKTMLSSLRMRASLSAAVLVAGAPFGAALAGDRPVVLELYTHPSCPETGKAAAEIEALFARPDVLGLVMPVDLWAGFGWGRDRAERTDVFRDRQNAFARALRVWPVATPQVVIDGVAIGNPRRLETVESEIAARRRAADSEVTVEASRQGAAARITVSGAPAAAELWLAVLGAPMGGDDLGLDDAHVVSRLEPLGPAADYAAGAELRALAPADARAVILVQDGPGGPILATAVLEPLDAAKATTLSAVLP